MFLGQFTDRRCTLAALALVALLLAGCGGGDAKPTEKGLRDTAQKFYDAITGRDGDAACGLMTKKLRAAVDSYGQSTRVQCDVAIVRFVPDRTKVVRVKLDGKTGEADVRAPATKGKSDVKDPVTQRGGSATALLKFSEGKWRVDNPGAFTPGPAGD